MYIYIHTHTLYTYIYIYIYTQSYIHLQIHIYTHTHTQNIYIYIYIYIYICCIIAEGFFFISSFFVLYILSFGLVRLRTFRLSAWVGADINAGVGAREEDVTITDVTIKTPDRKC